MKKSNTSFFQMGLFGFRVNPDEKLKQFKFSLRKSEREIEREFNRISRQENQIKTQMKNAAKKGQTEILTILAKDIVRNRMAARKMLKLKSTLESLGLRITLIKAQSGSMNALKIATQAMTQLNRMVNLPQMQAIMQKFMMENEMMDMKGEVMDGLTDDLWDDDGYMEEETANQYSQVFKEMGIPLTPQIEAAVSKPKAIES
ncbi:SNF7 family protein [Trichomonas vaginalis G3]|uniref:SNF7 family protein n=1 Tax=Trichomonas vaginalis (strain ATCC PRA-98 / G3) TaxID=412133 RepID=A2GGE6_TRIV3|nr:vacuolar transport [Trichomonas vaginalis G3]EAX83772.1 SNF7 family protein [Trichomonas vaginalis G3]KAI5504558.1 vacuolar transport [Trichomonas vaginalis G3]|eukprot:XP_001296702.1 SNF7 family protein [Trichomonas vaginalis G3]